MTMYQQKCVRYFKKKLRKRNTCKKKHLFFLVPSQRFQIFQNILENPKLKLMNGFLITAIPPLNPLGSQPFKFYVEQPTSLGLVAYLFFLLFRLRSTAATVFFISTHFQIISGNSLRIFWSLSSKVQIVKKKRNTNISVLYNV